MLAVLMEQQLSAVAVTFEFVGVAVVDFAFSTFVTSAEILFVPPEGRSACVFVHANRVCASLSLVIYLNNSFWWHETSGTGKFDMARRNSIHRTNFLCLRAVGGKISQVACS